MTRPPRAHQAEAFRLSSDRPAFELAMEQRTGKTKVIVDTCAYQYRKFLEPVNSKECLAATTHFRPTPLARLNEGGLNGLLVVAMPGRVHRNWVAVGFPEDWPPDLSWRGLVWDSSRFGKTSYMAEAEKVIQTPGFSVVAINGEAIITENFRKWLPRWLKARKRVMVVADEFTLIMSSWCARTKVMRNIAKRPEVVMRRILDGTPHGDTPLSAYYPWEFLDKRILGFESPIAFKHHFAKWETGVVFDKKTQRRREYPSISKDEAGRPIYLNLDELRRKKAPHSFRVLRKDCWDVPDKIYQTHPFQLTPPQRALYDKLRDEYAAELNGVQVTASHALTRYLRLQQVTSNFWPPENTTKVHSECEGLGCDSCEDLGVVLSKTPICRIAPLNPRIAALGQVIELDPNTPTLIWARFHQDIDDVMTLLASLRLKAGQYDGRVTGETKDTVNTAFQKGDLDYVVGHPRSGGRGSNFSRARLIVYYSNEFSLLSRLQSEDRAEAEGKKTGTGIIDLVAEDTLDDQTIIPALRAKKEIANYVMGERGGKWL